MTKTLEAIYDGEVLRPQEPLDIAPDTRVRVTIEEAAPKQTDEAAYPLTTLLDLATDMGVEDLASQHDRYARQRLEDRGSF